MIEIINEIDELRNEDGNEERVAELEQELERKVHSFAERGADPFADQVRVVLKSSPPTDYMAVAQSLVAAREPWQV